MFPAPIQMLFSCRRVLPPARRPGATTVAALLLAALLLAGVAPAARAQAVPGGKRPDVQVVLLPDLATGQWIVGVTYPKVVPRATVQGHFKRLLALSGWKAGNVLYENHGLQKNDGKNIRNLGPKDPPMSSVQFTTEADVVDWRNGTLPVEPFARTFRDLKNVYVTFFVPGRFAFRGLRRHSDANLDVNLAPGEFGAFTYVMNIKNHRLDVLNLPRFQSLPDAEKVRSAAAAAGQQKRDGLARARRVVGTSLVVVLAAVAAAGMYFWTHRWTGR